MSETQVNLSTGTPRWLHWLAIATACATFPLVIVGGLVTTTRVGMADTVWPTPPWYFVWLVWVGQAMDRGVGFLVEHGHRQLGWLVGAMTLALAAGLWLKERRGWLRWLGAVALAAVVAQGVLGGLRVVFQNQSMGMVHGVFAQIFFALMVCLAAFTGRGWFEPVVAVPSPGADRLRRLTLITGGFVVLQLVFGATLRHFGHTWALVAHLIMALVIVVHVALIAKRVFTDQAVQPLLVGSVERLGLLVLGQLMLGAGSWATSTGFGLNLASAPSGAQIFFATAHVSVGALILASLALLAVQTYRLIEPDRRVAAAGEAHGASSGVRPSVSSLESRELWAVEVSS